MRSATGSWRNRGSNGRFVASKPLDGQLTPVRRGAAREGLVQSQALVRSLNFRFADNSGAMGKHYGVREDLWPKPDLMAVIHQLEALNSFTLDCASHSS